MNVQSKIDTATAVSTEHFDVVIAGAGISGVGAAYHLTTQCPGTSFAVLEAQESFGGTWLTHRYPGIRSDSDLYTLAITSSRGLVARLRRLPRASATCVKLSKRTTLAPTFVIDPRSPRHSGRAA